LGDGTNTEIGRPPNGSVIFEKSGSGVVDMQIDSSGNLQVNGSAQFTAPMGILTPAQNSSVLTVKEDATQTATAIIQGQSVNGTVVFFLDTSGKVNAAGGFAGTCRTDGIVTNGPICNQDFAEAYASNEPTEAGDLVALVPGAKATVRRSQKPYDALLAGVVSSNPGLVFDNGQTHLAGDNSQLITKDKTVVALVGRVALKISMENGTIQVGDPIASSSKPGVGMKATEAGKIVGYALEPGEKDGRLLVYVQPGYHAAPEMAKLRASAQKLNRRAQEQELELQTLRQDNARLRSELNAILLQVNKINDQIVAASAKRGNATKNSPIRATEPVSEPMAH